MRKHAKKRMHKAHQARRAVGAGTRVRTAHRTTPLGEPEIESIEEREARPETYSAMETGRPEKDGRGGGPLGQEGEGERQNDQLAELEDIEPEQR
ncbi:MAG: hypothetical protein HY078_13365 [Elusimicrobia bacterium]|nr:hypothetical protein [Elusimicrobiota bacterium]